MIIECYDCASSVDGKEIAYRDLRAKGEPPTRYSFVECPVCKNVMVGVSDLVQVSHEDWDWDDCVRVWPEPTKGFDPSIPDLVRRSLENAKRCFQAKVYDACVVMCGKAIEAICVAQADERQLGKGLRKLLENGVIDKRLFEWAEVLRKQRNIGAHATEEETSREDAKDVLAFATALCDYIFVLAEKYKEFVERKAKKVRANGAAAAEEDLSEREHR